MLSRQVCKALKYLHENEMIFNNICPYSIYVQDMQIEDRKQLLSNASPNSKINFVVRLYNLEYVLRTKGVTSSEVRSKVNLV